MAQSLDAQFMTLPPADSGAKNTVKNQSAGAESGDSGSFARVFDQQRDGGRAEPPPASNRGKDLPAERSGAAAAESRETDSPGELENTSNSQTPSAAPLPPALTVEIAAVPVVELPVLPLETDAQRDLQSRPGAGITALISGSHTAVLGGGDGAAPWDPATNALAASPEQSEVARQIASGTVVSVSATDEPLLAGRDPQLAGESIALADSSRLPRVSAAGPALVQTDTSTPPGGPRGADTGILVAHAGDGMRARAGAEGPGVALAEPGAEVPELTRVPAPAGRADTAVLAQPVPAGAGGTGLPSTPAASSAASSSAWGGMPEFTLEHAPEDAEFPREVAGRMKLLVRDGLREARLQLHPAELGRLQVSVSTDGDQTRVAFFTESAAAREAIEQSMPRLREMLEQNGLQLAQSDVEQRDFSGHGGAAAQEGAAAVGDNADDATGPADVPHAVADLRSGLIDTYI